jgi:EF-P beta-lysylation protein EpmB
MIPESSPTRHPPRWQRELASAIRDPAELLACLGLEGGQLRLPTAQDFPLRVPRGFVARMRHGDADDPLLRQVLPLADESQRVPGFGTDPVGDAAAHAACGVLHKYHGRALLVTTGVCAVHCRYCFRRAFPYDEALAARDDWQAALDYLAADASIEEVILSGGDPLVLADHKLAALSARLDAIPHLRRLRIHTRLPIVLPERVCDELLDWLTRTRLATVMVMHANHSNEIDAGVRTALARLRDAGFTLLNQSVLLRGVNDCVDALAQLSAVLFEAGVLPYYLHMLDRVQGASHFEVEEGAAHALHAALKARLPGYLVPRLVREVAGMPYKQPIAD